MRTEQPKMIYLKDYQVPDYLIDETHLTFELFEDHSLVHAQLVMRRNPEAGAGLPKLVLDGQQLELLHLKLDDRELGEGDYSLTDSHLTLQPTQERFVVDSSVRIHPESNTALEGLYKSGKMFCTQCEAEGFRDITWYPDRPDVMAPFRVTVRADLPVLLSNGNPVAAAQRGHQQQHGEHGEGEFDDLRAELVRLAASLFQRGLSVGTAGNISVALPDGWLMTPTNASLGHLDAARISKLDRDWPHVGGDRPSKEVFMHRAVLTARPEAGAVVHLHSTHATALSCLVAQDPEDCVPPLTPYVVMRVGRVPLLDYVPPGDPAMGDLIRARGGRNAAVLLANHGPVVAGLDLDAACNAIEELEAAARLALLLRGTTPAMLTPRQVAELVRIHEVAWGE